MTSRETRYVLATKRRDEPAWTRNEAQELIKAISWSTFWTSMLDARVSDYPILQQLRKVATRMC